jgi:hypothetical protein
MIMKLKKRPGPKGAVEPVEKRNIASLDIQAIYSTHGGVTFSNPARGMNVGSIVM